MHELPSFPALTGVSQASAELIERARKPFTILAREPVIHFGERVESTYFVTSGSLRAYVQDAAGREKTIYHVGSGQTCILALNASFSRMPYPAWVAGGEEEARGFTIPGATYKALFDAEPSVRDFTIGVLTSWIFDLMTWIEATSLGTMGERLARVLVRRSDPDGIVRSTHQDLATDLSTAREVVSRHLGEFEARGWVARRRQQIEILDRRRLLEQS